MHILGAEEDRIMEDVAEMEEDELFAKELEDYLSAGQRSDSDNELEDGAELEEDELFARELQDILLANQESDSDHVDEDLQELEEEFEHFAKALELDILIAGQGSDSTSCNALGSGQCSTKSLGSGHQLDAGATEDGLIGVHRHRRSRVGSEYWEAVIWIPKRGVQVYLGQYAAKQEAMKVHDRGALKLRIKPTTKHPNPLNLPKACYAEDILEMAKYSVRDYIWSLKRSSLGFAKGSSSFKGVTRRGRNWEARFTYKDSNKCKWNYFLGKHPVEENAAKAYDQALLYFKGWGEVTNFRPNEYDVVTVENFGKKLVQEKYDKSKLKISARE